MQYTTRLGDRPSLAHVNYQCPCGCVAGLTYDRESGAEHLGQCCCGRLLWLGDDAEAKVLAAREAGTAYVVEKDPVTLPWGEKVLAALAVPAAWVKDRQDDPGSTRALLVRDVVCNMRIDPAMAAGSSLYDGVAYYFCAPVCKQRFDADPTRFLENEAKP